MFDDPDVIGLGRGWVEKAEHDLTSLVERLGPADRPDLSAAEQDALTRYATVTRYPGDYAPISRTEARVAVKVARRTRRFVRARLPKQAL